MILGIVIGWFAHEIISYLIRVYGLYTEAKARRERGEKIKVDYLNCKILFVNNVKENRNKQPIGFVVNR